MGIKNLKVGKKVKFYADHALDYPLDMFQGKIVVIDYVPKAPDHLAGIHLPGNEYSFLVYVDDLHEI